MDHRIPKAGLVVSIVCSALAILTFVFLNQAFEGPSVISQVSGKPYELTATFRDTEVLPTKQPVLSRGVKIGKVTEVTYNRDDGTATVHFTINDEYAPVRDGAVARIGERTILGDPYINLELNGAEEADELDSGEEVIARPSVDFDEAFTFLDDDGRAHVKSILQTLDQGTRTPGGGARLNATLAELTRTTRELRILSEVLEGTESDLAGLVGDSAIVLRELGSRELALREIVGSGRQTLDALASRTESLQQGLDELPLLLRTGGETLAELRPLLAEAAPLVRRLTEIAPDLVPAIRALGPVSDDLAGLIPGLTVANGVLRPVLKLLADLRPVVDEILPAVRNTVAQVQFISPRARSLGAMFANMAGVGKNGDDRSRWIRFAIMLEPGEVNDNPTPTTCYPEDDVPVNSGGFCHNAYPRPLDALDPEPYQPGSYPRVLPFNPPPAGTSVGR